MDRKWYWGIGALACIGIVIIILFASGVVGGNDNTNQPPAGNALEIGNQKIPLEWTDTYVKGLRGADLQKCFKNQSCAALYQQDVQEIADYFYQAASAHLYAQQHGITLTPTELAKAMRIYPLGTAFKKMPPAAQKYLIEASALRSKATTKQVVSAIPPPHITTAQALKYYNTDPTQFHRPEVRDFIAIPIKSKKNAQSAYKQLVRTTNKPFVISQILTQYVPENKLKQLPFNSVAAARVPQPIADLAYKTKIGHIAPLTRAIIKYPGIPELQKPHYWIVYPASISSYPTDISFKDAKAQIIALLQGRATAAQEEKAKRAAEAAAKKNIKCRKPYLATPCKKDGSAPVLVPYVAPS